MRETISIPKVDAVCVGCGNYALCGDFTEVNEGQPLFVCETCITKTIGIHPDTATEENMREDPQ